MYIVHESLIVTYPIIPQSFRTFFSVTQLFLSLLHLCTTHILWTLIVLLALEKTDPEHFSKRTYSSGEKIQTVWSHGFIGLPSVRDSWRGRNHFHWGGCNAGWRGLAVSTNWKNFWELNIDTYARTCTHLSIGMCNSVLVPTHRMLKHFCSF